jgi:hypothetical protein
VAAEDTVTPVPEPIVVEEVRVPTRLDSGSVSLCCGGVQGPRCPIKAQEATPRRDRQWVSRCRKAPCLQGEVNIIAAMVAFDDAPAPDLTADEFFEPQLEKITQWSDFWSQGKLRYEFQMVEDWVTVPVNHADYPINSRDDYPTSRTNSARVIQRSSTRYLMTSITPEPMGSSCIGLQVLMSLSPMSQSGVMRV